VSGVQWRDGYGSVGLSMAGGKPVVCCHGELDVVVAPRLAELLMTVLDEDTAEVVLVVRDVSLVDAAAMSTVVAAFKRARTRGTRLMLSSPSRHVQRVLHAVALNRLFP
jgi:anti-sigma B factor antagonist